MPIFNFTNKLLTLTLMGVLLVACGGDVADEGTNTREDNPLFDFGDASGFWEIWQTSQDVRECTPQSGIDPSTCFTNLRGYELTGVPYELKGYSSSLDFDAFSKHSEGLGGQLATLSYLSDDCKEEMWMGMQTTRNFMGLYPCYKFHITNYAPSNFTDSFNPEMKISGGPVRTHQSRVVYDFTDSKTTVAGLPLLYALYNYVESEKERDTSMYRTVTLVLPADEEDRTVLANALSEKFFADPNGCGEYLQGKCWNIWTPRSLQRGAGFGVEVGRSFEDLMWIEFSQAQTYTRPLSSAVSAEDL